MAAQARQGAHGVVQSAWQEVLTKREVSELWRGIARVRKLHCINTPSAQKTTIALFFTYRREKTFCTRSPLVPQHSPTESIFCTTLKNIHSKTEGSDCTYEYAIFLYIKG